MSKPAPKNWRPDREWLERFANGRRIDHLFRHFIHLERFVNATPQELKRWPHVFLSAGMADYGDPRRVPSEWDRLERQAQAQLEAAPGGPLRVGAIVHIKGHGFARVTSLEGTHATVEALNKPATRDSVARDRCNTAYLAAAPIPQRVELAGRIQRYLREWFLPGMMALDPSRPSGTIWSDPAAAWALEAARYAIAVHDQLGWGGARAPASRNRRAWHGLTKGGTPADQSSGKPLTISGRRLAYRVPQSWPRTCDRCGDLFHGRKRTARTCPDCRA